MAGSLFPSDEQLADILLGPESVAWRYTSDVRLYFVMLFPLLLQVAHPTVAAGVRDFSNFEQEPWERLLRTIDYVTLMVYGGRDAVEAGRRLRALHKRFRGVRDDGRRYYALEPEAYAWVHATLIEAFVAGQAHFGRAMSTRETECFYREYRGIGRLIGVREDDLPVDWSGFRRYFGAMLERLERTPSVDRVLRALRHTPAPPIPIPEALWRALRMPASRAVWLGGVGLMTPRLRDRLGIRWSHANELEFRALGSISSGFSPLIPARLRVTGPAQLRWRREAIAHGPLGRGSGLESRAAAQHAAA